MKANFNKLKIIVGRIPWSQTLTEKEVEKRWEFLQDMMLKALEQMIPLRRKNGRNFKKPEWLHKRFFKDLGIEKRHILEIAGGHISKDEYKQIASDCKEYQKS